MGAMFSVMSPPVTQNDLADVGSVINIGMVGAADAEQDATLRTVTVLLPETIPLERVKVRYTSTEFVSLRYVLGVDVKLGITVPQILGTADVLGSEYLGGQFTVIAVLEPRLEKLFCVSACVAAVVIS